MSIENDISISAEEGNILTWKDSDRIKKLYSKIPERLGYAWAAISAIIGGYNIIDTPPVYSLLHPNVTLMCGDCTGDFYPILGTTLAWAISLWMAWRGLQLMRNNKIKKVSEIVEDIVQSKST